ncbi:unnamed protein product, partial [Didymodactylos carnosus]
MDKDTDKNISNVNIDKLLLEAVLETDSGEAKKKRNKFDESILGYKFKTKQLILNKLDAQNYSALHYAVLNNNVHSIGKLLRFAHRNNQESKPLFSSFIPKKIDHTRCLDINIIGGEGKTPLHHAASKKEVDKQSIEFLDALVPVGRRWSTVTTALDPRRKTSTAADE